nr:eukaryotic translation initiation factor 4E [Hymenolepis microstoma]
MASKDVPLRRVKYSDRSQLPHDYSSTPGGSIFSTTPGGTRIYYDRDTLLMCKNSPIARSPPVGMICRPGVTCPLNCHGDCNLSKMPATDQKSAQKTVVTPERLENQPPHKEEEPFELDL